MRFNIIKMVSIVQIPSGLTLFSRIFNKFCENVNEEYEYELIGSFIFALKQFSRSFGQNEIKLIELSNLRFLIYEQRQIMIFFLLDLSDNIAEYKKYLKICSNVFLEMFNNKLHQNFNNTAIFQDFNSILQEILKIPPNKIEPSCLNCPIGIIKDCLFKRVQQKMLEFKKQSLVIKKCPEISNE